MKGDLAQFGLLLGPEGGPDRRLWGGEPAMAREARGSGTVGRNPGVRPVLEPVEVRRSAGAIIERSKSGPGAEGGGRSRPGGGLGGCPGGSLGRCSGGRNCRRHALGGLQGNKGRESARRGHTNGGSRMVSYTRRHTRGGCRGTVIIYRSQPLGGEEPYTGIWDLSANFTFSQGVMGAYSGWRGDNYVA